jgi:hypothetical protein
MGAGTDTAPEPIGVAGRGPPAIPFSNAQSGFAAARRFRF